MASPITWVGPDRDKGKFRPLILWRLSANLLGQDLLRQMDVIITTDHLASYDDKTEQGVIRLTLGFTPKSRGHCPQGPPIR